MSRINGDGDEKDRPNVHFRWTPAFGERLSSLIESMGTLARAGAIAGVTDEALAKWRDGKARPSFFGLANLAVAAGRSLDWLLDLDTPTKLSLVPSDPGDFAFIPKLNVRAAAGHGVQVEDEGVIGSVAFRREWLHRRGVSPAAAHVLTAKGDSMEPTIRDGDMLLVDTSVDRVVDNAIYVVVYSGRTLVKRVQIKLDGSLVLKSDNRDIFDDETVPPADVPGLNIAGRVMWFGRSI